MSDAALVQLIAPFALVLLRVSGLLAAFPLFMGESMPVIVRSICAVGLTLALTVSMPPFVLPEAWMQAAFVELFIGVSLGTFLRMVPAAVQMAGELMDTQMGFGFARSFDPWVTDQVSPVAQLGNLLMGMLFFVAGGPAALIRGLAASLRAVPAGSGGVNIGVAQVLSAQVGALFVSGLRMAGPILLLLLAGQLAMGLLARVAPQLNIWSMGFTVTIATAIVALGLYLPTWVEQIGENWQSATTDMFGAWVR